MVPVLGDTNRYGLWGCLPCSSTSSSTARRGIHAGVEGGVFEAKARQRGRKLDMINLGCMTYDVHTPNERLEISSVGPLYEILREILKNVQ